MALHERQRDLRAPAKSSNGSGNGDADISCVFAASPVRHSDLLFNGAPRRAAIVLILAAL
jgi:hypothetical protein